MIKYELRPYQQEAVNKAVAFFRDSSVYNAIEVLPTGSGKSLIIAAIIKELGEPTLVLQPTKEVLEQNFAKMTSYGYMATVYSASLNRKEISDITFATIGSIIRKKELFGRFRHIIIDECHFVNSKGGMYDEFIGSLDGVKVLGLTATPYRLTTDGFGGSILKFLTRTRPRVFKEVIYHIQNRTLFETGYLAKLNYYSVGGFDRSKIRVNTTGADFDQYAERNYYDSIGFRTSVIDVVGRLVKAGRKNMLVFTRFIEEAQHIVDNVPGCAIITGETKKKEREKLLAAFKGGGIKVVANVGVLTTGFDYPELETIVLARPTMSLALYYQMIGRGIRPHPGKESTWVVDMCGNKELFGRVEDLWLNKDKGKWYLSSGGRQLTNVYYSREMVTP